MKKKTRAKIEQSAADFEELRAYGYEVHAFEPWHLRISHPDYEAQVDVWPTTRKWWKKDTYLKGTYNLGDLTRIVRRVIENETVENSLREYLMR